MNTEEQIQYKLDELADFKAQIDALEFQKQDAIDKVLTPEIRADVVDIEAEVSNKAEAAHVNIAGTILRRFRPVRREPAPASCTRARRAWRLSRSAV